MSKQLVLCADDYGLAEAVNQGVLDLAQRGRLSAVSCMSNAPAWRSGAAALAALPAVASGRISLGLHFNLTEGRPLCAELARLWPQLPPLPTLLVQAHLRRLPLTALRAELQAQWLAFVHATGRHPSHLDGHQHVHALPGVRDLVLQWAASHVGLRVRATGQVAGPGFGFKRWVIARSGGRALQRGLQAQGSAANRLLLGVYDFRPHGYRALMQQWLARAPAQGALLFCHPAHAGAGDAIAVAREREHAYLGSADFAADLQAAGVVLA